MGLTDGPRGVIRVGVLIAAVTAGAIALLGLTAAEIGDAVTDSTTRAIGLLVFTVALQLLSVRVPGGGTIGVSVIGLLVTGFLLGAGAAAAVGILAGLVQWVYSRGLVHRAVFDSAQFALSAAAAAALYHAIVPHEPGAWVRIVAALAAGVAYAAVNNTLLCLAIGISSGVQPLEVWRGRFSAARYEYIAFGPIALAAAVLVQQLGVVGLAVAAVPVPFVLVDIRGRVARLRVVSPAPAEITGVVAD